MWLMRKYVIMQEDRMKWKPRKYRGGCNTTATKGTLIGMKYVYNLLYVKEQDDILLTDKLVLRSLQSWIKYNLFQ